MKTYFISIGVGILVGIIYALLNVRSPAPPAIALIGLLGMLIGEQMVPIAKRLLGGEPVTAVWFQSECVPKITGTPVPSHLVAKQDSPAAASRNPTEKS